MSYTFRYIVVCRPLHAKSICTLRRTRIAIGMVCLFSLVYNASRLFEYETDARTIETARPQLVSHSHAVKIFQNQSIHYLAIFTVNVV